MEDLSLHILDIVENALAADATQVGIRIDEDTKRDQLTLVVDDNGKGMEQDACRRATDPFFTSRTTRRVGLGLPLLAQAARETGGSLVVNSQPGTGTRVEAVFRLTHPDRKPLGDIAETLSTILASRRGLQLVCEYTRDSEIVFRLGGDPAEEKELSNGSHRYPRN